MTITKRLASLEEQIARLAEDKRPATPPMRLRDYTKEMTWPVIEPGTTYLSNWHLDVIYEHLEAVTAGQILRLCINIPPRYMKSIAGSIAWPTWSWTFRPESRWMFASYSDGLSAELSRKRRLVIQSPMYRERWGKLVQLAADQNRTEEFGNSKQGVMLATSMSASATGLGGDVLVVDDAHNARQAVSDAERIKAVKDFRETFSSRLDDKKKGAIVIIGQRLHVADLCGYAIEWGYTHLFLPAEATKKCVLVLPSGKTTERDNVVKLPSGKEIVREPGSLLWPEREGPKEIAEAKATLGTAYVGQYAQQPSPEGGTKFQRSWFKYFSQHGDNILIHRPTGDEKFYFSDLQLFQTADLAMGTKATNDFTVIASWGVTSENDLLLLHINRFRKEAPDVESELKQSLDLWRPQFQGIEKAHYGIGICQDWIRRGFPLKELIADKDKVTRSTQAALYFSNGKIFLNQDAPWLIDYEAELLLFPNGIFDDQVDVTSYAANVLAEQCIGAANCQPGGSLGPEFRSLFAGGTLPLNRFGY